MSAGPVASREPATMPAPGIRSRGQATNDVVIDDVRVFDGERTSIQSVRVVGSLIDTVGTEVPVSPATVRIDGSGCMLLPGLIDCHTHTGPGVSELALRFGVTTELDMNSMPAWMDEVRAQARLRDDVADVRSASTGLTVPGGHPTYLLPADHADRFPVVTGPHDVPAFVAARIAEGADYIKVFIEDGTSMLDHDVPMVTPEIVRALAEVAHDNGRLAVAHTTSVRAARIAVDNGIDGLVHIAVDQPVPEEFLDRLAERGVFVVPTLCTLGSITAEYSGTDLADDPRVAPWVPDEWRTNLRASWAPSDRPGRLAYAIDTVRRLHERGVRILAGSDAARVSVAPGTAHGVSLHAELAMLARAGLSAAEALRAATQLPAEVFGLDDRGQITAGRTADLVLVEGDPLADLDHTLSIRGIWRRGTALAR